MKKREATYLLSLAKQITTVATTSAHACMHVSEGCQRNMEKRVTQSYKLVGARRKWVSFHGHVLFPVLAGRVACIESSYIYLAARQCRAGVPMYMSQLAYKTVAFALILEGRPRREWQSALLTVSFNPPNRRRLQPKSSPPSSIASRRIKKINSYRYI